LQQVMPGQVALPRPHPRALPAPVSLGEIWPWALFAFVLLLLIYFVGADQGATSVVPGMYVHEFVHDGRHLLGFPCH
jgi:Probable cobalt transporter subunit (CbtB)